MRMARKRSFRCPSSTDCPHHHHPQPGLPLILRRSAANPSRRRPSSVRGSSSCACSIAANPSRRPPVRPSSVGGSSSWTSPSVLATKLRRRGFFIPALFVRLRLPPDQGPGHSVELVDRFSVLVLELNRVAIDIDRHLEPVRRTFGELNLRPVR